MQFPVWCILIPAHHFLSNQRHFCWVTGWRLNSCCDVYAMPSLVSCDNIRARHCALKVDAKDAAGYTALMYSCGHHPVIKIANVLLEAGSDPNVASRYGTVALHDAVMAQEINCVKLLLRWLTTLMLLLSKSLHVPYYNEVLFSNYGLCSANSLP